MPPQMGLFVSSIAFVGTHFLLSHPLRRPLVRAVGGRPFQGIYSIVSLIAFGLMMGVWFLSISVAQYVAGLVAQFMSVETVGGQVTNLKVSLDTYTSAFTTIAWYAIIAGVVLFVLSWPLQKWMHGVK